MSWGKIVSAKASRRVSVSFGGRGVSVGVDGVDTAGEERLDR